MGTEPQSGMITSGDGGGDGCTTIGKYLMPVNCVQKLVKMISVMPYIFYQSKKMYKGVLKITGFHTAL